MDTSEQMELRLPPGKEAAMDIRRVILMANTSSRKMHFETQKPTMNNGGMTACV
jgi:hypothetical protein